MAPFLLGLLIIIGCSMEDELVMEMKPPDGAVDQTARMRQVAKDGPVYLSGVQNYYTYATKSKELLQDTDIPCKLTLDFLEGQNIQITITKYPPSGERTNLLIGEMTPSGETTFSYPVPLMVIPDGSTLNLTDIIQGHGGCVIYGPGINKGTLIYHGYFDGEQLKAAVIFNSKCEQEWPANEVFPPPVDGPVHWSWAIDVTVD